MGVLAQLLLKDLLAAAEEECEVVDDFPVTVLVRVQSVSDACTESGVPTLFRPNCVSYAYRIVSSPKRSKQLYLEGVSRHCSDEMELQIDRLLPSGLRALCVNLVQILEDLLSRPMQRIEIHAMKRHCSGGIIGRLQHPLVMLFQIFDERRHRFVLPHPFGEPADRSMSETYGICILSSLRQTSQTPPARPERF